MRRLLLLFGGFPLLLSACSVSWPLAVTRSGDGVVVHLPSCTSKSVQRVRVVTEKDFEIVWEVDTAQPTRNTHEFVVGKEGPGFSTLVAFTAFDPRTSYFAEIFFGGSPGPSADVRFMLSDLDSESWWSEGHARSEADFESAARETGLCGKADFSFKSIFWSKFGVGCASVLTALLGYCGWTIVRRRRRAIQS